MAMAPTMPSRRPNMTTPHWWHAYGMANVPEPRMELERLKMELSSDAPSGAAAPAPSEAVESLCTGLASESDC